LFLFVFVRLFFFFFFFFNDTATTEIYTLSLHDALPILTSLATIIGLLPMALKLGEGSESYAPLARALIGGLTLSVILTVFLVPAAYMLVHSKKPYPA